MTDFNGTVLFKLEGSFFKRKTRTRATKKLLKKEGFKRLFREYPASIVYRKGDMLAKTEEKTKKFMEYSSSFKIYKSGYNEIIFNEQVPEKSELVKKLKKIYYK